MTSVEAARRRLAARFAAEGLDSPEIDARLLVGAALGLDLTGLAVNAARAVSAAEMQAIEQLARRRLAGEPVARIVGVKEFWGLPLMLSEATLVPRPETETVVEAALALMHGRHHSAPVRVADIATGSGALLLALLSELRNSYGVGTDLSEGALRTARLNAQALELDRRAVFVRCDFGAALAGPFDLIVANPPYVRTADIGQLAREVRDHDPWLALDGGSDGLEAYRRIIPQAAALLAPGGSLVVEVGAGQSGEVSALMAATGLYEPHAPRPDLAGIARVVAGTKQDR